ncbi:stalk domain-containing protein [Paenibacillus sp. WQ 127069]|uniref:Stalk domain-containing protein n=1 Tax=Paenibacillus baimaensis TaxID=2982185 RepID=A0ABT2UE04_9BACL|nr:stalk domain-containing protein [Paenibacillus sp. WQ 127069]MCU6792883.1 stalk domain-containing protein [Paenibacillus sp. WQ 127069]
MKKTIRLILMAASFSFVIQNPATTHAAENKITVVIDGKTQNYEQAPTLIENLTFVPMRAIFEVLGATVLWDDSTRTVNAKKNDIELQLSIGSSKAKVNGSQVALEVAPQLVNGYTMIPLRFVGEALNAKVNWEDTTQTVMISSNAKPTANNIIKPNADTPMEKVSGDDSVGKEAADKVKDTRGQATEKGANDTATTPVKNNTAGKPTTGSATNVEQDKVKTADLSTITEILKNIIIYPKDNYDTNEAAQMVERISRFGIDVLKALDNSKEKGDSAKRVGGYRQNMG